MSVLFAFLLHLVWFMVGFALIEVQNYARKCFIWFAISGTLLAGIVALDAITLIPFVILQIQVSMTSKNYWISCFYCEIYKYANKLNALVSRFTFKQLNHSICMNH